MEPLLEILSIDAVPSFSYTHLISAKDTIINFFADRPTNLWPTPQHPDGHTDIYEQSTIGSKAPVVLRSLDDESEKIPITVKAKFQFPQSWRGKKYLVVANSQVEPARRLLSDVVDVPDGASNEILVEGLFVDFRVEGDGTAPLVKSLFTRCPVPTMVNENFRWEIYLAELDGHVTEEKYGSNITKGMRLELYWVQGPAPNGPLIGDITKGILPRVELPKGYPIGLLRLFAFPPSELPSAPRSKEEWLDAYIERIMEVIWLRENERPRPRQLQYDTIEGRSFFNMDTCGGSFDLHSWMKMTRTRLNCFDAAAITQLACDIVVDSDGDDVFDARYIVQWPHGLVKPGPLYGWFQDRETTEHMKCNNPFWAKKVGLSCPWLQPEHPNRQPFRQHVWVEINRRGKVVVLDNTRRLKSNPNATVGTLSREEYLSRGLDIEIFERIHRSRSGSARTRYGDVGDCWMNPVTTQQRLGVTGITGRPPTIKTPNNNPDDDGIEDLVYSDPPSTLGEYIPSELPPFPKTFLGLLRDPVFETAYVDLPDELVQVSAPEPEPHTISLPLSKSSFDIDALLVRGKTDNLSANTIITRDMSGSFLIDKAGIFPPHESHTYLRPKTTQRVRDKPFLVTHTSIIYFPLGPVDTLLVDINVFNPSSQPQSPQLITLRNHIQRYVEVDSANIILPCSLKLGEYSFETEKEVFWVRGNVFLAISVDAGDAEENVARGMLMKTAKKLDKYMSCGRITDTEGELEFESQTLLPKLSLVCSDSSPAVSFGLPSAIDTNPNADFPTLHVRLNTTFLAIIASESDAITGIEPSIAMHTQMKATSSNPDIAQPMRPLLESPYDSKFLSAYKFLATGVGETEIGVVVTVVEGGVPVGVKGRVVVF